MPRRRTISCQHCGFLQLKRDEFCNQCGVETEQSKRRSNAFLLRIGLSALAAVGFYFYMQHVIHGLA